MTSLPHIMGRAALEGSELVLSIPENVLTTTVQQFVEFAAKQPVVKAVSSRQPIYKFFEFFRLLIYVMLITKTTSFLFSINLTNFPRKLVGCVNRTGSFALWALISTLGPDSVGRNKKNLEDIQSLNRTTTKVIKNYDELVHLLASLSLFTPSFKKTIEQVDNVQKFTDLHLLEIQHEIKDLQQINIHEVDSAIHYFMADLARMLSMHGENISVFPEPLEELKETEKRVQSAQDHLQSSKGEMQEVVEELKELNTLILEAGLEQDQALQELLAQAHELVQKFSSQTLSSKSKMSYDVFIKC